MLKRLVVLDEKKCCSFVLDLECAQKPELGKSWYGESGSSLRCRLHEGVCSPCWFMVVNATDGEYDPVSDPDRRLQSWIDSGGSSTGCFACYDMEHNDLSGDRLCRKFIFENAKFIVETAGREITSIGADSESKIIRDLRSSQVSPTIRSSVASVAAYIEALKCVRSSPLKI